MNPGSAAAPLVSAGRSPDPALTPCDRGLASGADGVQSLWSALEEVMDPEIPISLVDLGLIYDVRRLGGVVEVDLTFTATACPCMGFIRMDIEERLLRESGVREVRIRDVWDPPWTKERISPRGREQLKLLGVGM